MQRRSNLINAEALNVKSFKRIECKDVLRKDVHRLSMQRWYKGVQCWGAQCRDVQKRSKNGKDHIWKKGGKWRWKEWQNRIETRAEAGTAKISSFKSNKVAKKKKAHMVYNTKAVKIQQHSNWRCIMETDRTQLGFMRSDVPWKKWSEIVANSYHCHFFHFCLFFFGPSRTMPKIPKQ